MEVHHHPDIHHKPKKWKEYFLEFLMIFLAVTLGFLSESLREHITESKKERQYIEGFVRNLKDDTASLRYVIDFDRKQLNGMDSLLMLKHMNMSIDSNLKLFYYYVTRYCYNSTVFTSNDATLQQLKSTGDYRLIENDHVADSLTKYDQDIHGIYGEGDYYKLYFKDIVTRIDELIDETALADTAFVKNGKLVAQKFPPLRDENGKLETFFNKIFVFRIIISSYSHSDLEPQLENSKRLISFLKSKYAIQD